MINRVNMTTETFPPLPGSWSELSWKQLSVCWSAKIRYGGNPAVARVAALLELLGLKPSNSRKFTDNNNVSTSTGEKVFLLCSSDGREFKVTPRELSYMAQQAMPWFDFPYGDPGTPEKRDDKGNVIQEKREAVSGYVSNMRDAMMLQEEYIAIPRSYHRGHPHTPRPYKGRGQGWGKNLITIKEWRRITRCR